MLGFESSCDETGVALCTTDGRILGQALYSQIAMHKDYGGVVPELASRDHIRRLIPLMDETFAQAGIAINEDKRTLMTMGYSTSSIFAFHLHKEVPVFGVGSKFGRHDDLHFNFKEINGKNIRIFNNSPMNLEELSRFFGSSNLVEFTFKGVKYWYLDGNDFKYDLYRKLVLMAIKEKFYNIPAYLPSYTCNFFTKYDLQ